jgi:hypothetical protein
MPSTSRAVTSNPPSAAVSSQELAAPRVVGPSTTRYRKPFGARPSGSTVTTPMRPRLLASAAVPPWTDKGAAANPCDAAPLSDAGQLAVNADSAQSAKALALKPAKLRRVHDRPSHDRQNKRIRLNSMTFMSGGTAIPMSCPSSPTLATCPGMAAPSVWRVHFIRAGMSFAATGRHTHSLHSAYGRVDKEGIKTS